MPGTNYGSGNETTRSADQAAEVAKKAKESISDAAKTMKTKTEEFGRVAMNKLEDNRISAAGALHDTAGSIHENAGRLPNGPDMAHSAAEKVDAVAGYVDRHDTKQMMADVEGVVKRNPMPALLIAGAVGFLIGRTIRH
jgi:ElaB/YqjD/DUF883 family membrane-anchored ribosome-binding protein